MVHWKNIPQLLIKKRSLIGIAVIFLLLLGGGLLFLDRAPYRALEHQIGRLLKKKGIDLHSLTLTDANSHSAILSDIQLGKDPSLRIKDLTVQYSLQELLQGKVHGIEAGQVALTLYLDPKGWQIGGLENLGQASPTPAPVPLSSLFQQSTLASLLPSTIRLQHSTIHIKSPDIEGEIPFDLSLSLTPESNLAFNSHALSFKSKTAPIKIDRFHATAQLNEKKESWEGNIAIPVMALSFVPEEFSPLSLTGHFVASASKAIMDFDLKGASPLVNASFRLSFPPQQPSQGTLFVKKAQIPWGGGIISLSSVTLPLTMNRPITLPIHLDNVALSPLLSKVSGGKIEGTGKITGILPIVYYPDGHITLLAGEANAQEKGFISVPPSLLPGENQQLQTARTALQNFYYTSLKIIVSSEGRKSVITLALEGKNPEAFEGRQIHLKINLAGDLIPFLEQSILPFNHLKQLMNLKETP